MNTAPPVSDSGSPPSRLAATGTVLTAQPATAAARHRLPASRHRHAREAGLLDDVARGGLPIATAVALGVVPARRHRRQLPPGPAPPQRRARRPPRGRRQPLHLPLVLNRTPDSAGGRSRPDAALGGPSGSPARLTTIRPVLDVVIAGLVTGWAIAIPIGAVGALLVALSARTSIRAGSAAALGVATVDGLYAAVAVVGGAAIATRLEPHADWLRVASALVLLGDRRPDYLDGRRSSGRSSAAPASARDLRAWQAFAAFLALTAVNPTTVVYFAAIIIRNPDLASGGWTAVSSWSRRSSPAPRGSCRWPGSARCWVAR